MAEAKKTKVVRYKAPFHFSEREIRAEDWALVSAEGQATVVWSKANNFSVPASEFSAGALRYVETDPDLEIVEV